MKSTNFSLIALLAIAQMSPAFEPPQKENTEQERTLLPRPMEPMLEMAAAHTALNTGCYAKDHGIIANNWSASLGNNIKLPIIDDESINKDGEILWPTKEMWAEIEARDAESNQDHFGLLTVPEKVIFKPRIEKPEPDVEFNALQATTQCNTP